MEKGIPQSGNAKILVVDDNLILRELMETILVSSGYSCVCVEDGLAAIDHMKKEMFDVVISDVEMPRLNGFELLAHVKNIYPDTKIIMISGKYQPGTASVGLSLNDAHHFLAKPFSVNHFLSAIRSVLIGEDPNR
jgi:CheY-like chemotaxis protein